MGSLRSNLRGGAFRDDGVCPHDCSSWYPAQSLLTGPHGGVAESSAQIIESLCTAFCARGVPPILFARTQHLPGQGGVPLAGNPFVLQTAGFPFPLSPSPYLDCPGNERAVLRRG